MAHAQCVRAVVHALRSPLQSIQGFVDLLGPGLPDRKLERYVRIIRRDAERLAALVDDLSLSSELRSGTLDLQPIPFALEPLLVQIVQDVEERHPECVVAVECPDGLPRAFVDRERLRQVLWALLSDAAGGVGRARWEIHLCARQRKDTEDIEIVVRYHGACSQVRGVALRPEARRSAQFLREVRLSMVRELMRLMGGDLLVQPGAGRERKTCSFILRLPSVGGSR